MSSKKAIKISDEISDLKNQNKILSKCDFDFTKLKNKILFLQKSIQYKKEDKTEISKFNIKSNSISELIPNTKFDSHIKIEQSNKEQNKLISECIEIKYLAQSSYQQVNDLQIKIANISKLNFILQSENEELEDIINGKKVLLSDVRGNIADCQFQNEQEKNEINDIRNIISQKTIVINNIRKIKEERQDMIKQKKETIIKLKNEV